MHLQKFSSPPIFFLLCPFSSFLPYLKYPSFSLSFTPHSHPFLSTVVAGGDLFDSGLLPKRLLPSPAAERKKGRGWGVGEGGRGRCILGKGKVYKRGKKIGRGGWREVLEVRLIAPFVLIVVLLSPRRSQNSCRGFELSRSSPSPLLPRKPSKTLEQWRHGQQRLVKLRICLGFPLQHRRFNLRS